MFTPKVAVIGAGTMGTQIAQVISDCIGGGQAVATIIERIG